MSENVPVKRYGQTFKQEVAAEGQTQSKTMAELVEADVLDRICVSRIIINP